MRSALGVTAPAPFMIIVCTRPRSPLPSSGLGGALVSATSTSPFGSTRSQRGWSSPSARAATWRPAAAVGRSPAPQPTAFAVWMVGSNVFLGAGSVGEAP